MPSVDELTLSVKVVNGAVHLLFLVPAAISVAGVQWSAWSHLPSDDPWLCHCLRYDLGQVTSLLRILVSSFVNKVEVINKNEEVLV